MKIQINKTQTTLKAALLLTVLAMMTACGSQNSSSDSTDSASRSPVTATTSTSTTVLACNQKAQGGLTAKMMVYTDTTNTIRNDYMTVKFTQMPASFGTGDYIQFFRWQANTTSQVYLDPVPTQARFETLSGVAITNFAPVIYWGQVSALAAQWGISDVNTFFQYVRLVVDVRDPQANYDVLKVAMYNSNNVNTINMDMLMPAFAASPTDYYYDGGAVRASQLRALHPFASQINSGLTPAQFKAQAASFCF